MRTLLAGFRAPLTMILVLAGSLEAQEPKPEIRIGVLLDGQSARSDLLESEIRSEVTDLLATDFEAIFPTSARRVGQWTSASVETALDDLLGDQDLDLLLALGPIAAAVVVEHDSLPVPVVAPFVIDASLQGMPETSGVSGRENLNYLGVPNTVARDLGVLAEILELDRIALLIAEVYTTAIPRIGAWSGEPPLPGVDVAVVPVPTTSPERVVPALPAGTDALYVTPLMPLADADFERLMDEAAAAGLPVLSSYGVEDVEAGAYLTLTPPNHNERLARRVALHAQRILLGEAAESLPVHFSRGRRVTINMATARTTGIFPPWSVLTEAELLNDIGVEGAPTLDLQTVIEEAQLRSLEIQSQTRRSAAAGAAARDARATLLPRADLSSLGTMIDEDRADASFGAAPQRSLAVSGTVTQLLYSDAAWTGFAVERHAAAAALDELESTRLDVMERAAVAYLDVLRARTLERIQRENLRTTRSFLELAEVRDAVGDASPGELYRWQAQIAADRQRVLAAQAARNQATTELNRILDRPLEAPFETAEPELDDPFFITSDPRLTELTNDPWSFPVFRDFMVQEALRESTEMDRIERGLRQRERIHLATGRAYWLPEVALQATVSGRVAEGGAGTEGLSLPPTPEMPDPSALFPEADDLNWSLGLQASIPLFTSGARAARREEARLELRALQRERDELALQIEQRMRVALLAAGASFPSIDLARRAADASRRNLDLVRNAYSEGVVSIAELLDAQNVALAADEAAAVAVYDFLIDLMAVERALGRMGFFHSDQREDFFERATAFRDRARGGDRP